MGELLVSGRVFQIAASKGSSPLPRVGNLEIPKAQKRPKEARNGFTCFFFIKPP